MTDIARLRELANGPDGLLPCPFCGKPPQWETAKWGQTFSVACRNHECFGPSTPYYGNKPDAIAAWNRRVVLDELDASKARIAEVKPLEWGAPYTDPSGYLSVRSNHTLVGVYDVYSLKTDSKFRLEQGGKSFGSFDTIDAAKAAAQADYNARILSALAPPPHGDAK
jgi:hypothetical protein